MVKTKAVVFDFYGTLIEIQNKTKPYKLIYEQIKNTKSALAANFLEVMKRNIKLEDLLEQLKITNRTEIIESFQNEYKSIKLFKESIHVLNELYNRGFKLGLISNLATPYKLPFFEFELYKYIKNPIFSCDVGLIKPQSEIFQLCSERLKLKPDEILMVGDNQKADIDGAISFGFSGIRIDRNQSKNSIESINSLNQIVGLIN